MSGKFAKVAKLALGVGLLVALGVVIRRLGDESAPSLQHLRTADPVVVVVGLLSLLAVMVLNGLTLRLLVARFGVHLKIGEWLGVTLVASMLNLVSPISGAGALRGLYLKRFHGVTYTAFASVLAALFLCSLVSSAALAGGTLLLLGIPGGVVGQLSLAVCGAVIVGFVAATLIPFSKTDVDDGGGADAHGSPLQRFLTTFLRRVGAVLAAWRVVVAHRPTLVAVVGISLVAALIHGVAYVCAFSLVGLPIAWSAPLAAMSSGTAMAWPVPLAASAFARMGSLAAITPAGLGIVEVFGAGGATLVGVAAGPALVAVLVIRVLSSAVAIVGGLAFLPLLLRFRRMPS